MGFEPTTPEIQEAKQALQELRLKHGDYITQPDGTQRKWFTRNGEILTPYQCMYFVTHKCRFPKSKNPPKGKTVSENPEDWIPKL